jgi:hypothetical protein
MAGTIVPGPRTWSMTRDEDGHREYKIVYLVKCLPADGPLTALNTPGLPQQGDVWAIDNDTDTWAFCRPNVTVTPELKNEPNKFFSIEFTFTTKPVQSCKPDVENPLASPMIVSGEFIRYTEEFGFDRFQQPILNSAHEMLRGPQVEFDQNRQQVKIVQNVATLQLDLLSTMVDTVNGDVLWGFPRRCVKLSSAPWERHYYNECLVYYKRTLVFDIRHDTFDRDLLDEGTKVLSGRWNRGTGRFELVPIGVLVPPGSPTLVATPSGGSLGSNAYGYRIAARNAAGQTTLPGPEASVRVTGPTGRVRITWGTVRGAVSYDIYGRSVGDNNQRFLANVPSPPADDPGTAPEGAAMPTVATAVGTPPDRNNPQHFIRFQDMHANLARVTLNGYGLPAGPEDGTGTGAFKVTPGSIHVEVYEESDFTVLGIPTSF